jgi:hypothetical protein
VRNSFELYTALSDHADGLKPCDTVFDFDIKPVVGGSDVANFFIVLPQDPKLVGYHWFCYNH